MSSSSRKPYNVQLHLPSATALHLKVCKGVLHINARSSVESVIYALHISKVALVIVVRIEDATAHFINLQAATVGARDGSATPVASAGARVHRSGLAPVVREDSESPRVNARRHQTGD